MPAAVRRATPGRTRRRRIAAFAHRGMGSAMAEANGTRVSAGRRFVRLAQAFLSGDGRRPARLWLASLLLLSLAVGGVQVLISFAARDFVTALTNRDADAFYRNLRWYLCTFVLAIPIGVFYKFTADR